MLVQLGNEINDEEIPQQAPPMLFKINSLRCSSKAGAFFLTYVAFEEIWAALATLKGCGGLDFGFFFSSKLVCTSGIQSCAI